MQTNGSYHVSSFSANLQAEIKRLDAQVDLFWGSESNLITRYGLEDGMELLDCGCGPGRLIELLKETSPGLRCTGLEMDPILVEAAQARFKRKGFEDCEVFQGTAEDPGLLEGKFDFILMRLVLEHVPDPLVALRSLSQLLRPGGRLFIISNDFEYHLRTWPAVPELDDLYEAYCASRRHDGGDPCIGRRVPKLLSLAGFAVVGNEIEVAHNAVLGDDAFFKAEGVGIPAQLVSSGFFDQKDFESMIRSWKAMLADPDHCIMRQLFVAVGEKVKERSDLDKGIVQQPATIVASDESVEEECDFVAPTSELEKQLATLWGEAMGLEEVGIRSNFFDLGGDSLMLEQVHAAIQSRLGMNLQITTLFQYPTIETLAEFLSDTGGDSSDEDPSDEEPTATESLASDNVQAQALKRRQAMNRRRRPRSV